MQAAAPESAATAVLPPVSTLLRVGSMNNTGHHRNSASSGSLSPPCSPRTPAGALLPEPDFGRAALSSSSRSPSLASLGSLVASEQGGKRRPPPPPLTLHPLSSLGKPRIGRAASDERCSIRSLLNGTSNVAPTPRTAVSKVTPTSASQPTSRPTSSRAHSPPRSSDADREHFAYGPPPPTAPGRRSVGNEYFPPPPPPPATAPAHPDYHQHHYYHHPDMSRRHSFHPAEYYPQPPPHAHYAAYHNGPGPGPYHQPQYEQGTVFYPPPGIVAFDPMGGLGARAPISRTTKACDACRARKVRCDAGGYPSAQGTCSRCRESGRTCVYTATQKKRGPCPGRPARVASSGNGALPVASSGRRASLESREAAERRQAWSDPRGLHSAPAHPEWNWSAPNGHGQPPDDRYHPYRREPRTAPMDRPPVGGWAPGEHGDVPPPEHSPRHIPPFNQNYSLRPHEGAGWPAPPPHEIERNGHAHARRSMSPPRHR